MGKGSRDKGARGERELAALFRSRWDPELWKVERFGTGESGHDLRVTALDPARRFPWAIEVKRYADFDIGEVLRGPSARWLSWWQQAVRQARAAGLEPMLLTRGDRRPWWCWTPHDIDDSFCYVEIRQGAYSIVGRPLEDVVEQMPWCGGRALSGWAMPGRSLYDVLAEGLDDEE